MKRLRLLPRGLIGRATLVLMCAVLVEFLGSSILYERVEVHASRTEQARQLAEQLATARRVLDRAPVPERADLAANLSAGKVKVAWTGLAGLPPRAEGGVLTRMRNEMVSWEPTLGGSDLRIGLAASPRVIAAVQLGDGTWVQVSTWLRTSFWAVVLGGLSSAAILCLGVLATAALLLRSMGAPLRTLASAAEGIGQGRFVHVPETGAGDLRRVAQAFNSMQARIGALVSARTQALAAVSHDLRTPLARLRLRAGLVKEADTRSALEQDVDEMSSMLDSLLAYLRGAHETEPLRKTDVAAVCQTVVEAISDAGGCAIYDGPESLLAEVRPVALKRAIDNLVQNAVTYAGAAELSLLRDGEMLVFRIEDRGVGIPDAEMSRVVLPFERLDHARARNTSGLGLGLSIVDSIARGEGGSLQLTNREGGGLRAELVLPVRP